ncbi:MAG: alpha/beta hydrolase [Planctomycetes bacterium]|nr:alpha/beta hydrolase [Planctomycetota bacterium]
MTFPLLAAALFTLATLLPAALVGLVLRLLRRRPRAFWSRLLWLHAGLYALHLFVVFPAVLGYIGSRWIGTRPDEVAYAGPRLDAAGALWPQDAGTLRRERAGEGPPVPTAVTAAAAARAHRVDSGDGVPLRLFRLEGRQEPPLASVVLVHGLFRSAMEVEPVAALLRDLGCECWLLELRNHGGSGRAPFTGGLRESDDVVAAVRHLRAQPGRAAVPVVLFGVSLGSVAVVLALPRLDDLAGVVLDSPIDDLALGAHRMLGFDRAGDGRRRFRLDEPWRSLTIAALGWWSGFRVEDVSPSEVAATLPHDLPVLVVAGAADDRAPPDSVEAFYSRLPMPAERRELWIEPGAGHGDVWRQAPAAYRERLQRLLARRRGG